MNIWLLRVCTGSSFPVVAWCDVGDFGLFWCCSVGQVRERRGPCCTQASRTKLQDLSVAACTSTSTSTTGDEILSTQSEPFHSTASVRGRRRARGAPAWTLLLGREHAMRDPLWPPLPDVSRRPISFFSSNLQKKLLFSACWPASPTDTVYATLALSSLPLITATIRIMNAKGWVVAAVPDAPSHFYAPSAQQPLAANRLAV